MPVRMTCKAATRGSVDTMPVSYFTKVVCLECQHEMPANPMLKACPVCGSGWLDARYDYDAVAKLWPAALAGRERSLWRYAELLPLGEPDPEISMGEGFTSLIRLYQLEQLYDHPHIYTKDERQGPTSSFKDRQAALAVTAMRRAGITECVLASTGNAAAAYAAYAARAGIKLWLFLTSLVPAEKMREAALYGAEVVKVSGTYDETKHVAAEFAARKGIHFDRGAKAIPGKESMKTLSYEIAEQLGLALHPAEPGHLAAPDWYIQAVSGGIGPLGVVKGFEELRRMGLINKVPKLGIIQAAGCAPMVQAHAAGLDKAQAVVPKTLITVLATGDPGYSYTLLHRAITAYGGAMIAVEDGITFQAMRTVASRAGFSVEPATAVAFAGLEKLLRDGTIAPGETVVVNCSGHTFPAESHILGDQYILNLELDQRGSRTTSSRQEEGLGAALERLDEQITTILVVDDTLNDRRLIRRLLQRYKQYRVFEAQNGVEALKMVREHRPDLVVADLTMPEMDGFSLLERLKSDPETAAIPVIVVSAKNLTDHDRQVLATHSESVWTKGNYDTRALIDHVVRTLGDTPLNLSAGQMRRLEELDEPGAQTKVSSSLDALRRPVVVIDDNPDDLRLMRRYLESTRKYRVIAADSGRAGLKAIYEHHPELIVLDLMMPDMDGFAVLESLRSNAELRDIPIIVISAKTLSPDEQQKLASGIHALLGKSSFERTQFLSIINDILN